MASFLGASCHLKQTALKIFWFHVKKLSFSIKGNSFPYRYIKPMSEQPTALQVNCRSDTGERNLFTDQKKT